MFITNMRTKKDHRVGRLVRMHSDEMEDIDAAGSGDIVAMFGIECNSGDTFTDGKVKLDMTSMHVPEPVISLSIKPADSKSEANMGKALRRFTREDPTFRAGIDEESSETIIRGMGELHLEVYIERMKREYNAIVEASPPQVAYRETVSQRAEFAYTHKKQTGGSGQFGRVCGYIEPCEQALRVRRRRGGRRDPARVHLRGREGLPLDAREGTAARVPGRERARRHQRRREPRGRLVRHRVPGGRARRLARGLRPREAAAPRADHEGRRRDARASSRAASSATLMQRRAMIIGSQEDGGLSRIEAEVPLAEMFGYSTTLRSSTQGKAEFTMEFSRYLPVPAAMAEELMKKAAGKKAAEGGKK